MSTSDSGDIHICPISPMSKFRLCRNSDGRKKYATVRLEPGSAGPRASVLPKYLFRTGLNGVDVAFLHHRIPTSAGSGKKCALLMSERDDCEIEEGVVSPVIVLVPLHVLAHIEDYEGASWCFRRASQYVAPAVHDIGI